MLSRIKRARAVRTMAVLALGSAGHAEAGLAQTGALAAEAGSNAQADEARSPSGGDIVVTARKRQESLLSVPVIASVVPAAALERRATIDLKDIARIVPGLALSQTLGASGIQVSLRGVGTSAQNAGLTPPLP